MFTPTPRPQTAPPPIKWNAMSHAPRDGRWLLLDVEDGSTDCYDYAVSCVYIGRWNPKTFPDIGPHVYEWEIVQRYPDNCFNNGSITTHYAEGRVSGWLPLPLRDRNDDRTERSPTAEVA